MNKRYAALKRQFDTISEEIVSESQKIIDAEQRIGEGKQSLLSLRETLKAAIASGDQERINSLEIQIQEQEKLIQRDELLGEASQEMLLTMYQKQDVVQADLDKLFVELASEWLKKQVDSYDQAAKELLNRRSRLLACYDLLREKNCPKVYQDGLGDAFRFIPGVKIPIIKGFSQQKFLERGQGTPGVMKDLVHDEILEVK
jgi:hypothetical protein